MTPRPEVVVIGNVGVDTNVYLHTEEIDFSVEANFVETAEYVAHAGGIASRAYAQLGNRTAFIGHVGADPLGRWIRETFARDGIATDALFIDPAGTARSINFVFPDGRRKNFYDGKGHMELHIEGEAREICDAMFGHAKLAHFNLANWARELLPMAKAHGVTIACDLQDVVSADDPYRQDFIEHADILFFSAVNHADPAPLMRAFLADAPPDRVVIAGMGAEGCALGAAEGVTYFPPVEMDAPVRDTNGAGDTLAVGFLTSYVLDGYPLREAVRRGQIAARYTCALKATSDHLITRAQLDHFAGQQSGIG